VGAVNEAIEDGIGVGRVAEHRKVPRFQIAWWLALPSSIRITHCTASALI
jgi:hypothetical protein